MARVLLTRAAEDAAPLVHALRQLEHEPVSVPLLQRLWQVDDVALAAQEHPRVDWLVLTSGTTADVLAAAAPSAWEDARIAAVGQATARRLSLTGRPTDLVPSRQLATALAAEMPDPRGQLVLYLKADLAPSTLADALRARGATVIEVIAYTNVQPPTGRTELADALPVDATLLLSGSAARRLAALNPSGLGQIVVIGPTTAHETRLAGLSVDAIADPHSLQGLMLALDHALERG